MTRAPRRGALMDAATGRRIDAEIAKLIAETGRLNAETSKISAEAGKVAAEARWYPFVATAGLFAAAIAVVKLFMS